MLDAATEAISNAAADNPAKLKKDGLVQPEIFAAPGAGVTRCYRL